MRLLDCLRSPRRGRFAAAAGACALTLYVFNIYPVRAESEEPMPQLSVQALFDFEVPVGVIANGVEDGLDTWADDFFGDVPGYVDTGVEEEYNLAGWTNGWKTLSPSQWGLGTNGLIPFSSSNGISLLVDRFLIEGVSTGFLDAAFSSPVVPTGGVSTVSTLPSVSFEDLPTVFSYFSADTPPANSVGLPSSGLVSEVVFGDFWVSSLTVGMLRGFDGGSFDSTVHSLSSNSQLFGWLAPAWDGTVNNVVSFVGDHPDGIRKYVRFFCVLLYWVALYRFLIKRVAFVVESVFEGTSA